MEIHDREMRGALNRLAEAEHQLKDAERTSAIAADHEAGARNEWRTAAEALERVKHSRPAVEG